MKKVYTLIFLLASTFTLGQSPASPEWSTQPQLPRFRKENAFPVIGFSVSVPLFRKYTQKRQASRLKLPEQPALQPMHSEDGHIAFEVWDSGEAVVIGRRTTYTNYISPYLFVDDGSGRDPNSYEYDWYSGGGGGDSYHEEEPPKAVTKAKKFNRNDCPNGKSIYKQMWDKQNAVNKEQAAFVTDKGIFWLDDAENTRISSKVGYPFEYYQDAYGRRQFILGSEIYTILAIVHTHPAGDTSGPSPDDKNISTGFGVPNYVIQNNGIWKALPGGQSSLADPN